MKKGSIIVFFLLVTGTLFANSEQEAYKKYFEFENAVMSGNLNENQVESMYKEMLPSLNNIQKETDRLFFQARALFFSGMPKIERVFIHYLGEYDKTEDKTEVEDIELSKEERKELIAKFDEALELCEESLDIEKNANAYFGKALLGFTKGMVRGPFYAFWSAFGFLSQSNKAYKTDPNNLEAALMKTATIAIPARPLGNPEEALEQLDALFSNVTSETPLLDQFIFEICYSKAYSNSKEHEKALASLEKAKAIYPNNFILDSFEKDILKRAEEDKN